MKPAFFGQEARIVHTRGHQELSSPPASNAEILSAGGAKIEKEERENKYKYEYEFMTDLVCNPGSSQTWCSEFKIGPNIF